MFDPTYCWNFESFEDLENGPIKFQLGRIVTQFNYFQAV